VSKKDTRSSGGFYGAKYLLQKIENIEKDQEFLVQVIDLDPKYGGAIKEASNVISLQRDANKSQKDKYIYRLVDWYTRDGKDYLLIEERIRGLDKSLLFEKQVDNWWLKSNNKPFSQV
jgi:hypothetical protein